MGSKLSRNPGWRAINSHLHFLILQWTSELKEAKQNEWHPKRLLAQLCVLSDDKLLQKDSTWPMTGLKMVCYFCQMRPREANAYVSAHTHTSHRMLIWQPHNKQERFEPRRHISHSSALEYSTVNTRKERFELFRTTKRHKRREELRETDMETEKRHRHTPEQQLCSQRSVCSIIHLQGFRDRK